MTIILKPLKKNSASPRMVALSPYQMYVEQMRGISDKIRATNSGLSYYPAQFGGIKGQRENLNSQVIVQLIDFENNS